MVSRGWNHFLKLMIYNLASDGGAYFFQIVFTKFFQNLGEWFSDFIHLLPSSFLSPTCMVLCPTLSGPSPPIALLYGPGPGPSGHLLLLWPSWMVLGPAPLGPLLRWPSCMIPGPTSSGPSPPPVALLYVHGTSPLVWLSCMALLYATEQVRSLRSIVIYVL